MALSAEVISKLDLAGDIGHGPENGRAREQILRTFLRQLLPRQYGIDTGFVIDSSGAISRQIDIVIHRTGYHPVFEIGGVKHFMIESVAAVLENKAAVTSRSALRQSFENLASVKALDQTGRGHNYVVIGNQRGPLVNDDLDNPTVNVFGAVVADRSLTADTYLDELTAFIGSHDRHLWPNMYVAVRDFAGIYLRVEGMDQLGITTNFRDMEYAAVTVPGDAAGMPPLVDLAQRLANVLRTFQLIDFRLAGYFPGSASHRMRRPVPRAISPSGRP
jgi:hypothetical protein